MKYKEFRMLIFSIVFFFVIVGVCIYFALDHNRSKVIIGVILSFVVLMMLTSKHKVKIKHRGTSTLYILDAEAFYEELLENIKEYKDTISS